MKQQYIVALTAYVALSMVTFSCFASDLLPPTQGPVVVSVLRAQILGVAPGGLLDAPITDALLDFQEAEGHDALIAVTEAVSTDASHCRAGERRLSTSYESLLRTSVWSKDLLIAEDRVRLSELNDSLFQPNGKPTPGYEQYLTLKKTLEDALEDLNRTPASQQTAAQKENVRKSRDNFRILGDVANWGPKDSAYRLLLPRKTNGNQQKYLSIWPLAGAPAARALTTFNPPYSAALNDGAWVSVATKLPLGQGAPAWIGTAPTIRFKWIRLAVQRPWFAEAFFADDSWKHATPASDGTGGGLIGQYVTSVIFMKDISIGILAPRQVKKLIKEELMKSQSVSFGPIVLADRSKSGGPYLAIVSDSTKTIQIPNTILVGCATSILPKSSSPNNSYQW